MRLLHVFVLSPIHGGDTSINIGRQQEIADDLAQLGFAPFLPAWLEFQQMRAPLAPEHLEIVIKSWLAHCDALYVAAHTPGWGESLIAIAENRLRIPVFRNLERLTDWGADHSAFVDHCVTHGAPVYRAPGDPPACATCGDSGYVDRDAWDQSSETHYTTSEACPDCFAWGAHFLSLREAF